MRVKPSSLVTVLLIALCAVRVAPGQPADMAATPKTFDLKAIDSYISAQVRAKDIVGLSVAIMREGKIVFAKGYGKSVLNPQSDVSPDTMFAVGSITKQFTCACILLLAEEEKLSVDDKVSKYFPGLTQADAITLHDLMAHLSGYPDYYPLDFVDRRMEKPIEPDKLIQEYAGARLDFSPRARWSYSNTGYIILGRVVEKVSGESFATFLARRILKPLGMEHSVYEPQRGTKGVAQGYTAFALGPPEIAPPEASGWIGPAGGLFASASDLAIWDLALMEGRLVKQSSYDLMSRPGKLTSGRTWNYGCGLMIVQRDGETILRHGGAISGFQAENAFVPRTRSAVIVLTNCEVMQAGTLHGTIMNLLLKDGADASRGIPKIQGPSPKDAALDLLHQLQAGAMKRENLGDEYSHYLNQARVNGARERLKALGEPSKVEVDSTTERGGMEVALIRFTFKDVVVKASLYRTRDGKIQQFLLNKG